MLDIELKDEHRKQLQDSIELMQKLIETAEKGIATSMMSIKIYKEVLSGLIDLENKRWHQ